MSLGRANWLSAPCLFVFFFQAEDGIRDLTVTGVQTCALPISPTTLGPFNFTITATDPSTCTGNRAYTITIVAFNAETGVPALDFVGLAILMEIGRASCRERGSISVGAGSRTQQGKTRRRGVYL